MFPNDLNEMKYVQNSFIIFPFQEYDDDNEYTDYEDDDLFSESSEWQAEEPTEKPTTPTPTHRQMSKISSMKWQMYGTREKVEENRKKEMFSGYARSVSSATLAKDNFKKMNAEGLCKKPLPRVVSVQNEHPDPARSYTPPCTVLHRCADDTGCCHHHSMRCAPKSQEDVHLYFYIRTLDTLQITIEKLTFVNHTECHCIYKDEYIKQNSTIDLKSGDKNKNTTSPENLEDCSCPASFIPKKRYESVCTCKCDESKPECRSKKEGIEFFSLADRKCVLENRCGIPICEYGAFLRKKGRCPKKQEKLDAFEKLNIYPQS
ncbi:hypothetical protein WA026_006288 [Henosepilachna vigintioctopunctata]|uniref:Platelet-derived growth factor (PDGF) family profile domain-containing protein n=1 Tax=Henosepilachna vigintioctopunctata TaxID=420089 RepID=A0AAW1TPD3_9CUCU